MSILDPLPLALQQPLWLLLLPLPWLASRRQRQGGRLDGFAEPHLLRWLITGPGGRRPARPPHRILPLAWLLIIVAASGPYLRPTLEDPDEETPRRGIDIAVVVDLSPSMDAADVPPSRLVRAKLELHDLAARLTADRVALIGFSAYAYRILPLTHDRDLFQYFVDALDTTLTRRQGSNLIQGLEFAAQSLAHSHGGRAVVLLSDGETHDAPAEVLASAARLATRGIPVFALGIGTEHGAPVPAAGGYVRPGGVPVVSRRDRGLLQQLAERSGGLYSDALPDDRDWQRLLAGLERLRSRSETVTTNGSGGRPLYPILLAIALALLLWHGARRFPAALPALTLFIVAAAPHEAHASSWYAPWKEQAAYRALVTGRLGEAAALYRTIDSFDGWLGRGAAAYRRGAWRQALRDFTEAERRAGDDGERARAAYNLGNTLARLDRLEEAAQAYERALRWDPAHTRAALNLSLVNRARTGRDDIPDTPLRNENDQGKHGQAAAAGVTREDTAAGRDGSDEAAPGARPGRGAARPLIPSPLPGRAIDAQTAVALRQAGAVNDDAARVLRHRLAMQDVDRPRLEDEKPW